VYVGKTFDFLQRKIVQDVFQAFCYTSEYILLDPGKVVGMVLKLDGNSEHVAHA